MSVQARLRHPSCEGVALTCPLGKGRNVGMINALSNRREITQLIQRCYNDSSARYCNYTIASTINSAILQLIQRYAVNSNFDINHLVD